MLATLILAAREWFANRDERGQGLVEYALIIVLVAVVAIVALTLLGTSISDILNTISCTLANNCPAPPPP
jgi:pilus assembly protein Flp/PilA